MPIYVNCCRTPEIFLALDFWKNGYLAYNGVLDEIDYWNHSPCDCGHFRTGMGYV